MFGNVHAVSVNGISLSIFNNSISKSNCEIPLLP
ncbi:RAxF-45 family protein [Paenibacillus sp. DYY-L-2]